jgi:hypothetical protein
MTTNFSRSGSSPPRRNINRPLGGVRTAVQDARPAQVPPQRDTSVLVHDCFDQVGGETKPIPCLCSHRVGKLDRASLVRRGKADSLIYTHLGRQKKSLNSIVLRREYVTERVSKSKINGRNLLPAMLKSASVMSFKKGVIRGKNGTAIELEFNRTDALYWNTVLKELGLDKEAGLFLRDAAEGRGLLVRLTTLEHFQMAPIRPNDGIDPEVDAIMASTIAERKEGARRTRARVGAAGFVKGTAGGLTYGAEGKVVGLIEGEGVIADNSLAVYSPGTEPDSDDLDAHIAPTPKVDKEELPHDTVPDREKPSLEAENRSRRE